MVCVASVACVAIVAIFAMATRPGPTPAPSSPAPAAPIPTTARLEAAPDALQLKATDGQPLVWIDTTPLKAPPRPADPSKLPEDNLLRWYDHVFAGWNIRQLPQPPSPGAGPRGRKIVSLQYMDQPYWTAYGNGMKRLAVAYGFDLVIMEAGNDNKTQAGQVEEAIRMRPDLVILTPVDPTGVAPSLKRLHDEKIPVIASNLAPVDEGMKYLLAWTGPDDWGQSQMLGRELARLMNKEGGYCVIRHPAGASGCLARTWGAVSELKTAAPKMKCLELQSTGLKTAETKAQVTAWLKKYGRDLKGIISPDDSKVMVGVMEALKDAGREDVVCVSAGASRTGLELVKSGKLRAITYQSAEADGALPVEIAARWFRGETLDRPVYYLQKHIITAKDVDHFLPPQW